MHKTRAQPHDMHVHRTKKVAATEGGRGFTSAIEAKTYQLEEIECGEEGIEGLGNMPSFSASRTSARRPISYQRQRDSDDEDKECWRCGHHISTGSVCLVCGAVNKSIGVYGQRVLRSFAKQGRLRQGRWSKYGGDRSHPVSRAEVGFHFREGNNTPHLVRLEGI